MSKPELDARSKLMRYLKGWSHGAGRRVMACDVPAYADGYREGYEAYNAAAVKAQERFGSKLSILRLQNEELVGHETEENNHG